ncbi:MAG: type II toxin-antitoxin system PemK/MazF family toxin [Candidatus Desantisbacteria bacterium]
MIREGQIVLFRFLQTDQSFGKIRPSLVIRKLPGTYDDWLICMISSQISQLIAEFDEILSEKDADFKYSGLKESSIIRISRLAVVNKSILLGAIGEINATHLVRIKHKLSDWIKDTENRNFRKVLC